MKITLHALTGLLLFLTSCMDVTPDEKKNYIESNPAFFELHNGEWLTNNWIRKPENILTIHESFKKIGYINIIPKNLLLSNPFIIQDIYINKQGNQLLDSLLLTYGQPGIQNKYYREFWQRRKAEKNDKVVYQVMKDINFALKHETGSEELALKANPKFFNDTLICLLRIEYRTDVLTEQLAYQDFETLKKLGFHQSAFNLLYETYKYQDLKWNRDSLRSTLKQSDKYIYPWFTDNTK